MPPDSGSTLSALAADGQMLLVPSHFPGELATALLRGIRLAAADVALYLQLALDVDTPLATLDQAVGRAAGSKSPDVIG